LRNLHSAEKVPQGVGFVVSQAIQMKPEITYFFEAQI